MNKKSFLIILTITLLFNCFHNNPSKESLPVIDVNMKYPEKEIILSDIANITYVHLNSKCSDFHYRGSIRYITENTIVVQDGVSGSILFFSKDGNPKSRFNRYGNGPEEYRKGNMISYDEATDDVFISVPFENYIQVYSSKGIYKRKLLLPHGVLLSRMICFDNQSLIVYDDSRRINKALPKTTDDNINNISNSIDSSFFLISKTDGQVLNYIQMPVSQNDLSIKTHNGNPAWLIYNNIVKHVEGFLLCNPETDTVFLYNRNKELTPIIYKIPFVNKSEPKIILNNCMDVDKYQFIEVQTVGYDYLGARNRNKYYIRNKKTGEIYQQKIVLPDYKDKKIIISPDLNNFFHENGTHIEFDLIELKQAYRENKLNGKLKELVATLNELEDNNVFAIIIFK